MQHPRPSHRSARTWRAPGRVNLIGEHTDYAEGLVLPMAIDRECRVSVTGGPATGLRADTIRARSDQVDGPVEVAVDGSTAPDRVAPRWGAYLAAVVRHLVEAGASLPSLDLAVSSTVPAGAGLSSSSALTVALLLALADAGGVELDATRAARIARDAEASATGVVGGVMDQVASLRGRAGHALLVDCRDLSVEPIALPRDVAVLVAHSGVTRTLAGSEYSERRAATERAAARLGVRALRDATIDQVAGDPRARHVVTENDRVTAFADALRRGDVAALGPLLLASHASLRDDFEVSTPELDALVDAFVANGALGARLTGAGFGGCVVALAACGEEAIVMRGAVEGYRAATGRSTVPFAVEAADGAGPVA